MTITDLKLKFFPFFKSLAFGSIAFGLLSCDSSPSSDDDAVAPQSLQGVILSLPFAQGPQFLFTAGRGQDPEEAGFESGVFDYAGTLGQPGFRLTDVDDIFTEFGDTLARKWPDAFRDGFYRYRRVGSNGGRLEIWGNPQSLFVTRVPDGSGFFDIASLIFDNVESSDPIVMDITFDAGSGNVITSTDLVLTTPQLDERESVGLRGVTIPFPSSARLGTAFIPVNYSTEYDGPSLIFGTSIEDTTLRLTDDPDGTIQVFNFAADNAIVVENGEAGDFTVTYDAGTADDPDVPTETIGGTYIFSAIEDTDLFLLELDYNEFDAPETFEAGELQDGVVTLDFSKGTYGRPTALGQVNGEFTR